MKIKVASEKIIKAVKKTEGIELVLESAEDAKEALHIVLGKMTANGSLENTPLKDVSVTSYQRYETSAVDYKMIFLLEFLFEEAVSQEEKVSFIKALQEFFEKI
jgi:ribosomal protein L4